MIVGGLLYSLPWLALLAVGACRANRLLKMLSTLGLLCFLPAILAMSHSEKADTIGAVFAPVVFGVLGPFGGPFAILVWASEAPLIGFSSVAIGAALAAWAGAYAYRRGAQRIAVVVAFLTFGLTAWVASECLVELSLRQQAAKQFAARYCMYERSSVLEMIESGQSDILVHPHASALTEGRTYHWSFHESRWLPDIAMPTAWAVRQCA